MIIKFQAAAPSPPPLPPLPPQASSDRPLPAPLVLLHPPPHGSCSSQVTPTWPSQSSTYLSHDAFNAIDGDINTAAGTDFLTDNAWWQVIFSEVPGSKEVSNVTVYGTETTFVENYAPLVELLDHDENGGLVQVANTSLPASSYDSKKSVITFDTPSRYQPQGLPTASTTSICMRWRCTDRMLQRPL